jgi:hypothetical protein
MLDQSLCDILPVHTDACYGLRQNPLRINVREPEGGARWSRNRFACILPHIRFCGKRQLATRLGWPSRSGDLRFAMSMASQCDEASRFPWSTHGLRWIGVRRASMGVPPYHRFHKSCCMAV